MIPLVVRRYFHTLLLKQTVSYTPPLCRRGGRGGEAKGVKCVIPIVVHRYLHLSLLKQTVSCTPPLCRRGGWGGEAFFLLCKKGRRKIIFYIFPFYLYSFLSPPSSNSPLRAYPQGYYCICPLPSWEGVGKSQLGDLIYYCPT